MLSAHRYVFRVCVFGDSHKEKLFCVPTNWIPRGFVRGIPKSLSRYLPLASEPESVYAIPRMRPPDGNERLSISTRREQVTKGTRVQHDEGEFQKIISSEPVTLIWSSPRVLSR
jgi:hypothetical protein